MKMNQKYLTLCMAIKYKHTGLVDLYMNELVGIISEKHVRWIMAFLYVNGMRFKGGR